MITAAAAAAADAAADIPAGATTVGAAVVIFIAPCCPRTGVTIVGGLSRKKKVKKISNILKLLKKCLLVYRYR